MVREYRVNQTIGTTRLVNSSVQQIPLPESSPSHLINKYWDTIMHALKTATIHFCRSQFYERPETQQVTAKRA